MTIGSSKLAGASQQQRDRLENYVKLLLLWVAASDGKLEESELDFVSSKFPDEKGTITTDEFLAVIRNSDVATLEKALRMIADESRELRTAFLDMAITLSMADHNLAIAENHILRLYVDALHLDIGMLQKRFQALTGSPFPKPGDPGSPAWWDKVSPQESGASADSEHPGGMQAELAAATDSTMSIDHAHTVLGLGLNATQEDIELAYRNLAAIFQVDRVEAMGEAAVSVANARFTKIQEAYRILRTPD